jgi:hypothetical protein
MLLIKQDAQKSLAPLGEVENRFPPRGSLSLYRLVRRANFVCSRCSLEKTSKLVAYGKDQRDEPRVEVNYRIFCTGFALLRERYAQTRVNVEGCRLSFEMYTFAPSFFMSSTCPDFVLPSCKIIISVQPNLRTISRTSPESNM